MAVVKSGHHHGANARVGENGMGATAERPSLPTMIEAVCFRMVAWQPLDCFNCVVGRHGRHPKINGSGAAAYQRMLCGM